MIGTSAYSVSAVESSDVSILESYARDGAFDQNAVLNGLLDMSSVVQTSGALPYTMLPNSYTVWTPSEFDISQCDQLVEASAAELQDCERDKKLENCTQSSLPNIESLMSVSCGAQERVTMMQESAASADAGHAPKAAERKPGCSKPKKQKPTKKPKQKQDSDEETSSPTSKPRSDSPSDRSTSSRMSSDDESCDSNSMPATSHDGSLRLTREERSLLEKEGMQLPLRQPLSKEQERVLKRVRRKIRNKISAKNSRLKKQEYVDGLERRVRSSTSETAALQRRVKQLEKENESLLNEVTQLRSLVLVHRAPAFVQTGPSHGALPPIDTLSTAPKAKLLLVVAFSFAIAFLPVFGVQLRRPALLHSGASAYFSSPFGGASRILLTHVDVDVNSDLDLSVSLHAHKHVDVTPRELDEMLRFGSRLSQLKTERLANVHNNFHETVASQFETDDSPNSQPDLLQLSFELQQDNVNESESESKVGTELDSDGSDTNVAFNFTTTFVEFLQHNRSEF